MKGRLLDMGKPYPVSVYSVYYIFDHFFPKGRGNFKSYEGHEIIRFVLVNCERSDFFLKKRDKSLLVKVQGSEIHLYTLSESFFLT